MGLDFLNAFKFIRKKTFLHELDPRSKLLLSIVYTILGLIFTEIIPLFIILLTLIPMIISGKIFKKWLKSMKGLSFLFIIIILLNTFFSSLTFALAMTIRIIIMVSAFSLFFLTVDPNDLALSLSMISKRYGYQIGFTFSLAFRFVPTIAIETEKIKDAQQSRGYEMQTSGLLNQIKNLFPLLVPLIICSIKRAFNVAEALESRAFGSNKKRTYYYTIKYSLKDWIFTFYLLALLILMIFIRININLFIFLTWGIPL